MYWESRESIGIVVDSAWFIFHFEVKFTQRDGPSPKSSFWFLLLIQKGERVVVGFNIKPASEQVMSVLSDKMYYAESLLLGCAILDFGWS